MHIPKLFAVFSLAAFCAVTLHAQRPDSDIQAQAREALRKAMGDTSPGLVQSNTAPAAVTKSPAQPASKPTPVVTAPPAKTTPPAQLPPRTVRTQPQISPDEQVKQMEIQRANALNQAAPVTSVPPAMATTTPAPVVTAPAKPVMTVPVTSKAVAPVAKTSPPPAQPTPPAAKPVATPAPVVAVTAPAASPMSATPAPATGSKEAQLSDLLQQYKAGSISPMEYQERRAKIRAEPDKQ